MVSQFLALCKGYYRNLCRSALWKGVTFFIYAAILFSIHLWKKNDVWAANTKIPENDIGSIATIIFGITSGVLALIGLVAIFVSLNSQHKIQKCRELYWEIISLSNKKMDLLELSSQMTELLWHYTKISAYDDQDFIKSIIKRAQWTILIVLIMWSSFVPFIHYSLLEEVITWIGFTGGLAVLLFFHSILGRLDNLIEIGKLKEPKDIFNIMENNDFRGLVLLIHNLQLQVWKMSRNSFTINLNLTAPLQGIKATVMGVGFITWSSAHKAVDKRIGVNVDLIPKYTSDTSYTLGFSELTEVNFDISSIDTSLSEWVDSGIFWTMESEDILKIKRTDDRFGFYDPNEKPGYTTISLDHGSEITEAVVPHDTYAVRIYILASLKESTNQEEQIKIVWEIPLDLDVEPRIVSISMEGSNGRQLKVNYWELAQIEEDFENFERKQREKDDRWART
ncbi:hypothetical protein [Neobacillus cucumis]|uniref:Uncharacterized protein n=1 Tax=Neobacillus cucumis TaxID=1740721 RepID=A0A2N5H9Z2_9BACI|nr:hypothetical protein [Neobacillus cucumis]PLS02339.1 hypothetical protein CVD27_20380 [Neobacillus cucumis]